MINWPNTLSVVRILLAPILLVLALNQLPFWYLLVLACAIFTDLLDGFLARHLNQVSQFGAQLDSWGDFIIYSTMAVCAWILWPVVATREALYFGALVISCVTPVLVGLVKFKTTTSYHTWGTKAAVAVAVIGYLLLFSGISEWPLRIGALLALYAGAEELLISLVLTEPRADVRSLRQALRLTKPET